MNNDTTNYGSRDSYDPNIVLETSGLCKRYTEGVLDVSVLDNVNLVVHKGATVVIMGASGSGKSTLLHILGALDAPSKGRVMLLGQDLLQLSLAEQGKKRNAHLGFIYQFHHLLPEFSALDNIAMPLFIRRMPAAIARHEAMTLLDQIGLAHRAQHRPSELSGGERQRVAVARALVTKPDCILADEPTGNLDRKAAHDVFGLMLDLSKTQGTSFVVVSHDPDLANRCDTVYVLENGRLRLLAPTMAR
jgi:lipoprotein-releasing system ATP-binding protein